MPGLSEMKKKFHAHIVAFAVVAMSAPVQAEQRSGSINQELASHTYVIPRDLIEMIYKPDYSSVRNPNPNWPNDPVVRLHVQWPAFTASTGAKGEDAAKRKIIISMLKGATRTVAQHLAGLNESHFKPEVVAAQYDLKEIHSDLSKKSREYIASPQHGPEYLIRCNRFESETIASLYYSCDYDFDYFGLKINVYFNSPFLRNWREIQQKTVALLNSMRKD